MSRGTLLRRRGERLKIHRSAPFTDGRGNETYAPTGDSYEVRAAVIADRSARAEVPGQMHIDVVKAITDADLPGVNIWSRIEWDGRWWDVVAPPALRSSPRHLRHWTIIMRARVDDGGIPDPGGWA